MKTISAAGITVVPAILALEQLGFSVSFESAAGQEWIRATRGEESYSAEDPVSVLGLVKLVELKGWDWGASDPEIQDTMRRHSLDSR